MVYIQIFLRLVIYIDLELADFLFCFCGDDEVVCRKDLKLFTLSGLIVLNPDQLANNERV